MGKRRQIKKGERARVEQTPDHNGCKETKSSVNEGGSRKGREEAGSNTLLTMATDDAKPLVNEGGSRKGNGKKGTTH